MYSIVNLHIHNIYLKLKINYHKYIYMKWLHLVIGKINKLNLKNLKVYKKIHV